MNPSPFRIGVSGHQNLGDATTWQFVVEQFRELLTLYRQKMDSLVLYSSLAIGADQLFVQTALEFGIPVEAVIPCSGYEGIFHTETDYNTYMRLLQECQQTHHLPPTHCSEEAFLAAGQWIVDQSDLMILAWNGYPPQGRGGTGDMAAYARLRKRPFVHLHTRHHTVKRYGAFSSSSPSTPHTAPKRTFITTKETVYQGPVLTVNQYRLRMPDGQELVRDIVERPASVFILPIGSKDIVLLIEEYDLGAGAWQLTLPGGKIEPGLPDQLELQAQRELQQETGYRAGRLEKLIEFYGHPGYVAHQVHVFVAHDLEWDPLELDAHEEIKVQTYTMKEALDATTISNRCDPEAALILWLYAQKVHLI